MNENGDDWRRPPDGNPAFLVASPIREGGEFYLSVRESPLAAPPPVPIARGRGGFDPSEISSVIYCVVPRRRASLALFRARAKGQTAVFAT